MLTTIKTSPGRFDVLWNGKRTDYYIGNFWADQPGTDTPNIYGFCRIGTDGTALTKPTMIGTLAAVKSLLSSAFSRTAPKTRT